MVGSLDFFQIIYKEEHRTALFRGKPVIYPFAKVHFNHNLTHFFENTVIKELVLASTADKISVCSWKLIEKMPWNVCAPRDLTEDVLKTDYDVLSFTCNTKHHSMMAAAEKWHAGFRSLMTKILTAIGEKTPSDVKNPIYQNHFSASSQVYKDYVNTCLIPAMEVMDSNEEINTLCWKDSNYSQLAKDKAATREYLQEKIGVPFYPMFPFLLERLFSIFCHNKKIRVTYL